MTRFQLVYPMLALVLLTFSVGVMLFRARVRSVREGHTPASFYRIYRGSEEPEFAARASRHFSNLYEAPTLFYAGCLAAMLVGTAGTLAVILAWGYVAARLVHTWVHLGGNRLRQRIPAYFASWIFLLGLWLTVGVEVAIKR